MPAGPYSDDTVWVADMEQVLLQPMDDITLAFHKVSGDTHVLNFFSAATLKVLAANGETFASATGEILKETQLPAEDLPEGLVKKTILQLDDVGLVSPRKLDL